MLELDLQDSDLSSVEHDFVPSMRRLLEGIRNKKSLFLILDDINGLAGSADFANWLKSTVDEIATSRQKTRLCILVVGPDERRRDLADEVEDQDIGRSYSFRENKNRFPTRSDSR